MVIILSIGRYERYISRYIVLEGLLIRYKNPILANIPNTSSDILLSDMKTSHPIGTRYPIFRNDMKNSSLWSWEVVMGLPCMLLVSYQCSSLLRSSYNSSINLSEGD